MSDFNFHQNLPDMDQEETDEWLESLRSVFQEHGPERARMILHELMIEASRKTHKTEQIVQRTLHV